jgi:isopentenyldiphosphate isomerase
LIDEIFKTAMQDHEYPNTTVVDKNDENPRYVRYHDALENGWIRRIAEVFVIDRESQKILLQLRSGNVDVSPNSWTASVGEGVDEGEDYEDAATRGLGEELGLPVTTLHKICKNYSETGRNEKSGSSVFRSWSKVYATDYDGSVIKIEKSEIDEVRWYCVDEIDRMLQAEASLFSLRFPQTWSSARTALSEFMGLER